ncbi:MAG TPA: hypothetical protein ENH07_10425 [Nitrospirae bacterium]|nr:hypothetical protein [Nitrospirota bacterium]
MEKNHLGAHITAMVESSLIYRPQFLVESIWDVEHWRKGQLLDVTLDHNICTDEGLNALLDIMFHGATQITTWYVGIFESDTTPVAGTTYAVPVYTESTAYTEAARVEYAEAVASGKIITNSANKATFTMNATKTIYGAALVGGGSAPTDNTDVAGGGTMYCASKFVASKSVESGDVLKVTVSITSADA